MLAGYALQEGGKANCCTIWLVLTPLSAIKKRRLQASFSFILLLCYLTFEAEGMSQILNLEDMGTLLTCGRIGGVQDKAQTAIERAENHTVTTMLIEQRLGLLTPWADNLASG
jgi:hypothetical protein